MGWITGAIVAGATLLGSMNSANASENSAKQIAQADEMSAAEQLGMYQQTRADLLPYMTSGNAALSNLDKLMGITPTAQDIPADTLGPLSDKINAAAFGGGAGAPGESKLNKLQDPYNLFGSSKYGHQEAVDPIGYNLFGSSALNPGHEVNRILGGLSKGGRAKGGRTYVVGEKGPEILHMAPGASGYVEPNSPKANALAYGPLAAHHRMYGGPVGPYTGDPINPGMGPQMRPGLSPRMRPVSPLLPLHPMSYGRPMRAPMAYDSPLGYRPGMPMIQHRFGGGEVGGHGFISRPYTNNPLQGGSSGTPSVPFDPTAGNSTALPGSGQTPADIMAQAPQYQFTEQQGIQGLDQSAAASGSLLSGGHIKDILNYSQGLASEQYQNIFNNLQSLTSLGESAGAMVGNSGTYAGMGMGQSAMAAGNAIGAGTVGAANAYSSGLGNLGFMYAMNPGMFGGSSTGGGGTAYPPQ